MEQSMLGTNILLLVARALCGKNTTARVYASFKVENRLKRGMSVEQAVEAVKKEVLQDIRVAIDDWRQPGIDFGMGAGRGDAYVLLFRETDSAIAFLKEHGLPKHVFLDYHLDTNPNPKDEDDFSITTLPYIDALHQYCIENNMQDKFQDITYTVISDHEKRNRIHWKWHRISDEFDKQTT
jgi:hypothetical protein